MTSFASVMSLQRVLDKMLLCILVTKLACISLQCLRIWAKHTWPQGWAAFATHPKVKAKGITVQHYWNSIESTVLG